MHCGDLSVTLYIFRIRRCRANSFAQPRWRLWSLTGDWTDSQTVLHTWVICIKEVQISFILKHVVGLQCWSITPQIRWHATFGHRWAAECRLSYHESKILSIKTMETAPHWSKCHPLLWGMVLYNITYSKLKAKVTEAPSVLLSKVSPSLFIWAASLLCAILIVHFFLLKCDKRHPSMQPLDLSLTLLTFFDDIYLPHKMNQPWIHSVM